MSFNYSNYEGNSSSLRSEYNRGSDISNYTDCFNQYARRASRYESCTRTGLTLFAFKILMLWRKSKNEIKQLQQSLHDLKNTCSKVQTQLRACSCLVKVEQSRRDELAVQLKRSLDGLRSKTAYCKHFSISLSNLKNRQTLMEHDFKKKMAACEAVNEIFAQTKRQLFRSMMEQRNLHLQLCKEQRLVQTLENQKKLLITEIQELNTENRQVEENYIKQLKLKDGELVAAKTLLRRCQGALIEAQKSFVVYENNQKYFIKMQTEIQLSRSHLTNLQNNNCWSFCHRLGLFCSRIIQYPKYTVNYFHILAYCLLPAMPAPTKFKFN